MVLSNPKSTIKLNEPELIAVYYEFFEIFGSESHYGWIISIEGESWGKKQ